VEDVTRFAALIALVSGVGLVAVLSSYVSQTTKVPAPLVFLVGAIIAVRVIPDLHSPPEQTVQRLVTVALVVILFAGGSEIGRRRFRESRGPILALGLLGTILTAVAVAGLARLTLDVDWYRALLLAAAIAPTDPAVVFSVLGQREIAGRSSTILQGESGANDPVGIALMASLLGAGALTWSTGADVAVAFTVQMVVGAAFGVVGSRLTLWFNRRVPMPTESLYPLRVLGCVFLLYGAATALDGSGFLAVFVAGILLGDERMPYKPETQGFFAALASLSEIVAFIALGLTVDLGVLSDSDVWVPGLLIAVLLTVVIRPLLVGSCLLGARLRRNEAAFVLFAGLKGAVPILLGTYLLTEHVADGQRLYEIVVTVVLFSVLVQGGLVPWAAVKLRLPLQPVSPEPWSVGIRLQREPDAVQRVTVVKDAAADGQTIDALDDLPADVWISLIVRDDRVLPATGHTRLAAGDQMVLLAQPADHEAVRRLFEVAQT
jgi:cell volume regulation protein A